MCSQPKFFLKFWSRACECTYWQREPAMTEILLQICMVVSPALYQWATPYSFLIHYLQLSVAQCKCERSGYKNYSVTSSSRAAAAFSVLLSRFFVTLRFFTISIWSPLTFINPGCLLPPSWDLETAVTHRPVWRCRPKGVLNFRVHWSQENVWTTSVGVSSSIVSIGVGKLVWDYKKYKDN